MTLYVRNNGRLRQGKDCLETVLQNETPMETFDNRLQESLRAVRDGINIRNLIPLKEILVQKWFLTSINTSMETSVRNNTNLYVKTIYEKFEKDWTTIQDSWLDYSSLQDYKLLSVQNDNKFT